MRDELMEKITLPGSGKYVVAVSGGVDSMSLLHMLVRHGDYELIVAHANHGLREDAEKDQELVEQVADQHGLLLRTTQLRLDDASEEAARRARYDFLCSVRTQEEADGIITAHHKDDRVETMLLNQQRGAGWFGLSPLHETNMVKRPLLEVAKQELYTYAQIHGLQWREDATNRNPEYTPRNRLRQQLSEDARERAYHQLNKYDAQRQTQENYAQTILGKVAVVSENSVTLDRTQLLMYDVSTVRDVLYIILKERFQHFMEIDFDAVVRLEHFFKTGRAGKRLPLSKYVWASIAADAMVVSVAR